jgi:hypothetical protein
VAISKNYVTDYGGDDTGVTPSSALWTDFRSDALGEDATLLFPDNGPGHNTYLLDSVGGGLNISWSKGTNSLVVNATGATLTGDVILGAVGFLDRGIDQPDGVSARIMSVNAGATQVQLTAASAAYISRATVGNWMCVNGFDVQGIFLSAYGVPPNAHFFDYVQITAVGTDTIDFTPPLQYSYSDQWPCFNKGDAFGPDNGGPASVFFMDSGWNGPVTVNGGTFNSSNQIGCGGRDFTINGGDADSNSLLMSTNKSYRAINHTTSSGASTEYDKLNDYVYIEGGSYGSWHCQSSSNRYNELRDATFANLNGTVKNTVVDGCTITSTALLGPAAYGIGETFTARNTSFGGSINAQGAIDTNLPAYMTNNVGGWGMANGVITMPISTNNDIIRMMVPDPYGRNIFFWGSNLGLDSGSSRVLSVTADAWPGTDNQTATTNITISSGSPILQTSASIFTSADVGRVMVITNVGGTMKSAIIQYDSATQVRLADNFATNLTAQSRSLQWGTCNIRVQTNETGSWPSSKLLSGYSTIRLRSRGLRTVSFENCTGTEQAVDLSQAAARNKPFGSYTKREYTGQMPTAGSSGNRISAAGAVAGTGSRVPMTGFITSLKINVITPYTGVQGTLTAGLAQFGINLNVNGTSTGFNPRINVREPGERVFTPGVAATGGQSGDTLPTLSADAWILNGFDPVLSTNVTTEYLGDTGVGPVFTIEMITDQGGSTGPIAVTPLRMRLRGP